MQIGLEVRVIHHPLSQAIADEDDALTTGRSIEDGRGTDASNERQRAREDSVHEKIRGSFEGRGKIADLTC